MEFSNTLKDIVRDYECDVQGIVNNAVYMNYCENARNRVINALGYTLHELHNTNETPVLAQAEMKFKNSLQGGDIYEITTSLEKKGSMRLMFYQEICKIGKISHSQNVTELKEELLSTKQHCLSAAITVAVLSFGKPITIDKSIFGVLFRNSSLEI